MSERSERPTNSGSWGDPTKEGLTVISTDELRDALHAYADDVPAPDPAALVAGAEHKRSHARKVRTAVIAAAAAVLMAVVTVVGVQGMGHEKALTPAQLNKKFHTHYAEYTRGLKLTNIVEVPVRQVPDPNDAPQPSNAVSVTLPNTGSAVYVVCDASPITDAIEGPNIQVRGSGSVFTTCDSPTLFFGTGKPGEHNKLWIVMDGRPKVSKAPIAIYTQMTWDDYPVKTTVVKPKPAKLNPRQSPTGGPKFHNVLISGSGSEQVTKTVHVPASYLRGGQFAVSPSSTGRFQVLVDGQVQRLDYTGLPAKYGGPYGGWDFSPETRGRWLDYWPDSAQDASLGRPPRFVGPKPGQSATITVRAVDTKGPWQAMLSWQEEQKQ